MPTNRQLPSDYARAQPERWSPCPRPTSSTPSARRSASAAGGWRTRYGDQEISQFHGAEMMAEKWDLSRAEMEAYALQSHQRAIRAIDEGRFKNDYIPYGSVTEDEGPRRDTSPEKMASLKTLV